MHGWHRLSITEIRRTKVDATRRPKTQTPKLARGFRTAHPPVSCVRFMTLASSRIVKPDHCTARKSCIATNTCFAITRGSKRNVLLKRRCKTISTRDASRP